MRAAASGARRNDGNGSGIENGVVEVLGVVDPVGEDVARPEAIQQILAVDYIAKVAGREHKAHWQAQRIDGSMDFCA